MLKASNLGLEQSEIKGTGHFLETLSVGSVPGTDHSQIKAFLINNRF